MENETLYCANCNKPITGDYLMIGDNYLQVKYFDDPSGKDNVFCSEDCLMQSISVIDCNVNDGANVPHQLHVPEQNYLDI